MYGIGASLRDHVGCHRVTAIFGGGAVGLNAEFLNRIKRNVLTDASDKCVVVIRTVQHEANGGSASTAHRDTATTSGSATAAGISGYVSGINCAWRKEHQVVIV